MESRPIRIAFLIIGAVVTIVAGYFVYLGFTGGLSGFPKLPGNSNQNQNSEVNSDVVQKDEQTGEYKYTDQFYKDVQEKTYDELVAQDPDLPDTFGIQSTEAKAKFDKEVLNGREPQNNLVEYTSAGLSTSGVYVLQGDYVTLMNKSSSDVKIIKTSSRIPNIGENGEELPAIENSQDGISSEFNVPAGTDLTIGFDFLGEFAFDINENKFSVTVIKSYEDLNP